MQLSVDIFEQTIRTCRSKESSGDPELRSDTNPSYRQCLVTALLANEFLGLSVCAERVTNSANITGCHYFNKDKANTPIRFCEEQFANERILTRRKERLLNKESIDFLLERHPEVQQKYEILREKFEREIQKAFR